MPQFDVKRISKADGSESIVRVTGEDEADAQRAAMDDLYLIGNASRVAPAPETRPKASASLVAMRLAGVLLVIVGVLLAAGAVNSSTSTETDLGRTVHNIGLIQRQTVGLTIGLCMALAGWLTFVLAECVEVVCRVIVRVS
jgi:hypothetical protein